jgi:hypothetical protein
LSILRRLLEVVSRHKLIALVVGGVAVAAAVAIVLVTTLGGPSKPASRYGDPALDALVAVPEQLYSPPNPLENNQDAAKRLEPFLTHELFLKMSVPAERQSNYKMGLVADQKGTVKARAYVVDAESGGVSSGPDTKNSVSRSVIVIQDIDFPDGRRIEDKFGVLVDVVLDNGKWKAKSLAPAPLLDELTKPPPPATTPTTPTSGPTSGPTEGPTNGPTVGPTGGPTNGPTQGPTNGPTSGPTSNVPPPDGSTPTITNTTTIPSTVTSTIPSPTVTSTVPTTVYSTATVPTTTTITGPGTVRTVFPPTKVEPPPPPGTFGPPPIG